MCLYEGMGGVKTNKNESLPRPNYRTYDQQLSEVSVFFWTQTADLDFLTPTLNVWNLVGLTSSSWASRHGYNDERSGHIPEEVWHELRLEHPGIIVLYSITSNIMTK